MAGTLAFVLDPDYTVGTLSVDALSSAQGLNDPQYVDSSDSNFSNVSAASTTSNVIVWEFVIDSGTGNAVEVDHVTASESTNATFTYGGPAPVAGSTSLGIVYSANLWTTDTVTADALGGPDGYNIPGQDIPVTASAVANATTNTYQLQDAVGDPLTGNVNIVVSFAMNSTPPQLPNFQNDPALILSSTHLDVQYGTGGTGTPALLVTRPDTGAVLINSPLFGWGSYNTTFTVSVPKTTIEQVSLGAQLISYPDGQFGAGTATNQNYFAFSFSLTLEQPPG